MLRRWVLVVFAAMVAGCASPPPSQSPTPVPAPGASAGTPVASRPTPEPTPVPAWGDAAIVQPDAVNAFASQPPGYYCDPCHNLAEDNLFGVAAVAGGFIAVGAVTPPARAIALRSTDGSTWSPVDGLAADQGSAAVAAAQAGTAVVLVGHDPSGATAWVLDPHGGWTRAPDQASLRVPYAAGGMTSIVPFADGFAAAGYRDDPTRALASAAVWRSGDGLRWTLDADTRSFAGGRILGLAALGDSLIAVGTAGSQTTGPAAAWRWTAATGWRRASVPPGGGAMRAVVATPTGLVAVGVNGTDAGAAAWTSADGTTWQPVPDQPAFHFYDLPVRLQALVVAGGSLVAGGWRSDPGKGSSVVLTSTDGRAWQAGSWQASFSGGQIDGLASASGTLVAAGRTGYPDTDTAAVWYRGWP
jgi:hypothetical protein